MPDSAPGDAQPGAPGETAAPAGPDRAGPASAAAPSGPSSPLILPGTAAAAGIPVAGTEAAGQARGGPGQRYAAGIYGTIITAAILAAAGPRRDTLQLAMSIVVTLTVFWLAEQYAELLGEHLGGGRLVSWHDVRTTLARTWPMVASSVIPLLVLLAARGLGAAQAAAPNAGLVTAVLLLMLYGWQAGRSSHLRGRQQLVIAVVAALLGLLMVALKVLVLTHLH